MPVETLKPPVTLPPFEQGGPEALDPAQQEVSHAAGGVATEQAFAAFQPTEQLTTPEVIGTRTAEALEACDFEATPEMAEHIHDYFSDHYELAADIQTILGEDVETLTPATLAERKQQLKSVDLSSNDLEGIIEYGNMPPAISRLVRPKLNAIHSRRLDHPSDPDLKRAELMLLGVAAEALFAEPSLAVTTVNDQDLAVVESLSGQVIEKIKASGLAGKDGAGLIRTLPGRRGFNAYALTHPGQAIKSAQDKFWRDSRPAGQLLFHNSPNMPEARSTGALMPRREQKAVKGATQMTTAEQSDGHIHSPTIHWSELFDPTGYKGGSENKTGGSVGVPLAEIIAAAPYARDAEYGVLRIKPGREALLQEKLIPVPDELAFIGTGSADAPGMIGTDRTFYSSPHDVTPDAPLEQAPDGYQIKLGPDAYAIAIGDKEASIAEQSGLGERFPGLHEIKVPELEPGSWSSLSHEQREQHSAEKSQTIRAAISNLQRKSIAARPNEFVVPLRSGVFDFYIPDDQRLTGRPRAQFTRVA